MMDSQKKMEGLWAEIENLYSAEGDIRAERQELEAEARKQFKEILLHCQVADCEKTCESMLCLDVRAIF